MHSTVMGSVCLEVIGSTQHMPTLLAVRFCIPHFTAESALVLRRQNILKVFVAANNCHAVDAQWTMDELIDS